MNKISILILMVGLCGCASDRVDPIICQSPDIILPADPIPATRVLNKNSLPADVMKAWVSTALSYRAWNKTVRRQIEASS
jgi:hypothetical protein